MPSAGARLSPPACSAPPRCSSTRCSTCTAPASCGAASTTIYRLQRALAANGSSTARRRSAARGAARRGRGPAARRRGCRRAQSRRRAAQRDPFRRRQHRLARGRAHRRRTSRTAKARAALARECLGLNLQGGTVMHAGLPARTARLLCGAARAARIRAPPVRHARRRVTSTSCTATISACASRSAATRDS